MKAFYFLALIPFAASAGQPYQPPAKPSSEANAAGIGVGLGEGGDAAALSSSHGVGIGHGGKAVSGSQSGAQSGSLSSAHQGQATTVTTGDVTNTLGNDSRNTNANKSTSAAASSNDGNSLSTSYENDTTALALGLASVTAAPVASDCMNKQTAGWRVTLIERTGRNKYDERCLEKKLDEELEAADFARCMDLARAYLAVRAERSYLLQLERCGGALERALIDSQLANREAVTSGSTEYATKEELRRAFEANQGK